MTKYTFGEGTGADIWKSPRYLEAKKKAIEVLESDKYKNVLTEGDFWILQGKTKNGKIAYNGLIISHNGCLKINDVLDPEKRFRPECVSIDKEGFGGSLVFSYCCSEQGIFEVGEVNKANCTNAFMYAMALKRCMDRVILKASRLAYSGIYSDSEAEEFRNEPKEDAPAAKKEEAKEDASETIMLPEGALENPRKALVSFCKENGVDIKEIARIHKLNNESPDQAFLDALSEVISIYG